MNRSLSQSDNKLLFLLYPALFVIAFLQTRAILPPYFFPTTGAIVWPLRLIVIYVGIKCLQSYYKKYKDAAIFVGYSLFTFISYLINGFSLSLFALCSITYLFPVLFVYVGMDNGRKYYEWFYKSFFWSCVFCCVIGIILYFTQPSWYIQSIIANFENKAGDVKETTDRILELSRYASFLGDSYAISYITMASLPIGLFLWANAKNSKKTYLSASLVIYFSSLLCQHRASMFCTTMVFVIFLYWKYKKNALKVCSIAVLLIVVVLAILHYAGNNEVVALIVKRFGQMNYEETMGIRSDQTTNIMSIWHNYLFGEGLGAGSGFARQYGLKGVPDGAYIELLYELGIVGFVLFLSILIKSLKRAWKFKRFLFIEFSILVSYIITMTGAGPFVYFFYMIPFWFAIGRIMNPNYLKYLQDKQYKV